MAVEGSLTVPIVFDTDGFKKSLDKIKSDTNAVFTDLAKKFDSLNSDKVFTLNTKQLQKDIDTIDKKIADLQKSKTTIALDTDTTQAEKAIGVIDNRLKELQKAKQLRIDIKEARNSKLKDIDKNIKELVKKREIVLSSGKSAKEVNDDIKDIERELEKLQRTREIKVEINEKNINQAKIAIEKLNKAAKIGAVAVAGIGTALGLATKQAIDFETQFAEVSTLLGDMSADKIEELKQAMIDLSKETGILTNESVPALYQAISAGVDPNNAIDFLKTASQNAIGGVTNLTTSVDGLTSIINAYGKTAIDVNTVSDLMFTTMKLGKTTIGELSQSYYNVIPTASALGVAFKYVSAMMSTITAAGVPTSVATTQLRQMLVELGDSTTKAGKKFQELSGKSFKDFIAQGGNVQQALQLMEEEAQRNNITINQLFSSVEAGNAVLGLTGSNTEKFTSDLEAMNNSIGATTDAFKKLDETPARRIAKLNAEFKAFTLELGRNLIPTFEKLLSALETNKDAIIKFGDAIGSALTFLINNGKTVVSIVAGLGAGLVSLNVALALTQTGLVGITGGLGGVVAGLTALNVSTGGIIVAIGLLVTALTALILNFDKVKIVINDTLALFGNLEAKMNRLNRIAGQSASAYNEQKTAMAGARDEADKLIQQYDKLNKKQNKTAGDMDRLKAIQDRLNKTFPGLGKALEETGGKLEKIQWYKFLTVDERKLQQSISKAVVDAEKAFKQAQEKVSQTESDLKLAPFYQKGNYEKQLEKDKEVLNKAEEEYNRLKAEQAELIQRATDRQKGYIKGTNDTVDATKNLTKVVGLSSEEYNKMIANATKQTTKTTDPLKELEKEYEARKELIENTIDDETTKNEELLKAEQDYQNSRLTTAQSLYIDLKKAGKDNTDDEKARLKELEDATKQSKERLAELNKPTDRLSELEKNYQMEKEIIDNTITDEDQRQQAILNLDKGYYTQRLSIQQDLVKEILSLTGEEREAREGELQALYDDIKETQQKINELNTGDKANEFMDYLKSNWQSLAQNVGDIFGSIMDIQNNQLDAQLEHLEKTLDRELEAIEKKLERETEMYEKQLEELEEKEEKRKEVIEKTQEEINELNAELGEHATEEEYEKYQEQLAMLEEKLASENEALALDEENKALLQQQQQLREQEAEAQKEQLQKKFAIEEAKIKRTQAENDKKTAIVNATISLATGIAGALANPLTALVMIPILTAIGATQIALITSQRLPEIPTFNKGGIVGKANNMYYEKLVGTSGNSEDKTLIWASEGERILTKEQNRVYESFFGNTDNSNHIINNTPDVDLHISFNGGNYNEKKIVKKIDRTVKSTLSKIIKGY